MFDSGILGLGWAEWWHLIVQTMAAYLAIRHGVKHGNGDR